MSITCKKLFVGLRNVVVATAYFPFNISLFFHHSHHPRHTPPLSFLKKLKKHLSACSYPEAHGDSSAASPCSQKSNAISPSLYLHLFFLQQTRNTTAEQKNRISHYKAELFTTKHS